MSCGLGRAVEGPRGPTRRSSGRRRGWGPCLRAGRSAGPRGSAWATTVSAPAVSGTGSRPAAGGAGPAAPRQACAHSSTSTQKSGEAGSGFAGRGGTPYVSALSQYTPTCVAARQPGAARGSPWRCPSCPPDRPAAAGWRSRRGPRRSRGGSCHPPAARPRGPSRTWSLCLRVAVLEPRGPGVLAPGGDPARLRRRGSSGQLSFCSQWLRSSAVRSRACHSAELGVLP